MNTIKLSLLLVGALVLANVSAHAQTTSNGPYYATPSWDQQLPASTRFIVLSNWNNAAVLDRETGLVWEQAPNTIPVVWLNAQVHCNNSKVGNRKGWRLPTIQELASLIDPTVSPSAPITLPAGHPFAGLPSDLYWSSTTFAEFADQAWIVDFRNGDVHPSPKTGPGIGWCVRGGQGVDPQ